MNDMKNCSSCNVSLPFEKFATDKQKKDNLRSNCKDCERVAIARRKGVELKPKKIKPALEEGKKYCPKCDNNVSFLDFNKDSSTKSGLESCCRNCKNIYKESVVKLCGIYKITNPIGQVYIGSSKNITNRWSSYKKCLQNKIGGSLNLYGYRNHTFEIIEECLFEDLKCRERYWQDFYDVLGQMGLNDILEKCGNLTAVYSEDLKNRIRATNTGKKQSEETKRRRKENYTNARLVLDLSTGIFFYSIKEAAYNFNIDRRTLHSKLTGRTKNTTDLILC